MKERLEKDMKENKIIVHKNILNINNLIREFPTKILEIIEFKNFIIIRIGYNSQISDNIFCINYENKIIWNISEIIKREISTAGYYCYFGFKNDMEKSKNNGFVGNVNLILSNENIGGAMIFLENGLLKMIECYFWQQNTFFEDINKF